MSGDLEFDSLELGEFKFTVKGVSYRVIEASGEAACAYRNAQLRATKVDAEGAVVGIGNMADTEPLLVSLCTFDDKDVQVPLATVKKWPSRVIKILHDRIKQISALDETEDLATLEKQYAKLGKRIAKLKDPAKNVSAETPAGSE